MTRHDNGAPMAIYLQDAHPIREAISHTQYAESIWRRRTAWPRKAYLPGLRQRLTGN